MTIFCLFVESQKHSAQISDKDCIIAKLIKEKSQLMKELQKSKDITTDTKCIQCTGNVLNLG